MAVESFQVDPEAAAKAKATGDYGNDTDKGDDSDKEFKPSEEDPGDTDDDDDGG